MGYMTMYTMEAKNCPPEAVKKIDQWLDEQEILDYALLEADVFAGCAHYWWDCAGKCSWYDHAEDMKALSEAFPEVTFLLHGEGEDQGDVWNLHCQNGDLEYCRMECHIPQPKRIPWF